MQAIAAGFQGHVYGRAGHESKGGVEGSRLDFELLHHGLRRRVCHLLALHVAGAVQHELVAAVPGAIDGHGGRRSGVERTHVGGRLRRKRHSRRKRSHQQHHPVFAGQFDDGAALHDLSQRGGGCVKDRRFGGNVYALRSFTDLHRYVDGHAVAFANHDTSARISLKPGPFNGDGIGTGNEKGQQVVAAAVRYGGVLNTSLYIAGLHRRSDDQRIA
jgi:hypothetical protein